MSKQFSALGNKVTVFEGFETFTKPENVYEVELRGDELTAFCPVTHQPDFYEWEIRYYPDKVCLESKTMKLYIGSMREKAAFVETLASDMAREIGEALQCAVDVTLTQQPRGGISIAPHAMWAPELPSMPKSTPDMH